MKSKKRGWGIRTAVMVSIIAASLGVGASAGLASRATATISLSPTSGPPGTKVTVTGAGFGANETVDILFHQSSHPGTKFLGSTTASSTGAFTTTVTILSHASVGPATIRAQGVTTRLTARATFTVT